LPRRPIALVALSCFVDLPLHCPHKALFVLAIINLPASHLGDRRIPALRVEKSEHMFVADGFFGVSADTHTGNQQRAGGE
jgi:hypothetical protein